MNRAVLVLVCTAQLLCVLDETIVNVALPSMQADLRIAEGQLSWVVNAYLVTFGGLLLLGGRTADRFPPRTPFVVGLGLFGVASLACGIAPSSHALVAARAVQGAGAAFMSAAALTILTTVFRGAERVRALGVWGSLAGVGAASGMLLGGALTALVGWRWVFLINPPIIVVVLVGSIRLLATPRAEPRARLDVGGALAVTLGLGSLLVAIVSGSLVAGAVAVALLAAFVMLEQRSLQPLVPLEVFRLRNVAGGNICSVLLASALVGTFFFLTLYLQQVLGLGPFSTGLAYLPMSLTVVITAAVTSRHLNRVGTRRSLAGGFGVLTVALLWLSGVDARGDYLTDVLGPEVLAGVGLGICLVGAVTTATADLAETGHAGLGSGLVNTTNQLGAALGLGGLSTVAFAVAGPSPGAVALTRGFQTSFLVAAGLALTGVAVAVFALGPDPRAGRTGT